MHLAAHLLRAAGTTLAAALLAVLLAVAQAVVQAGPAAAVEAQGLRVDPVEDTVLGSGSELRPALIAGGSVTYPLRLRNTRDVAVEALVYGADVMDGEVASGADNSGVGSWITTDEQVIELGPETALVIEVTVTRPEDDVDGLFLRAVEVTLPPSATPWRFGDGNAADDGDRTKYLRVKVDDPAKFSARVPQA